MRQFLLILLITVLVACQQATEVSQQIPSQEPAKDPPIDQPAEEPSLDQPLQETPIDREPPTSESSGQIKFLTIDIHRKSFDPPSATADQGTKLVLTNRDTILHPVYIRFEDEIFLPTKMVAPGDSLTAILDRSGIYKLFESTYGLKGRVDVEKSIVIVPVD